MLILIIKIYIALLTLGDIHITYILNIFNCTRSLVQIIISDEIENLDALCQSLEDARHKVLKIYEQYGTNLVNLMSIIYFMNNLNKLAPVFLVLNILLQFIHAK